MTNDTDMRPLSAHEAQAASGGVIKELILAVYANYVYDCLKNGQGEALKEARKAVTGTLKPLPPT
jgi:hypothetical protein